ncbi:hypothetical protein [Nocardioides terrisoli]|uniref:hypothetical protein n=1 Tax=Nocardioides terrisoli TaxID=3388267 RepID=UPI00287BBFC9|nr:hypothetical protein [Nocardioides marmorisolisilvae]
MTFVQAVVGALCALAAVVIVVQMVRNRPPGNLGDGLLALIEVGLVVQLGVGIVRVGHAPPGVSVVTYVGYLIGSLLILPAAWIWAQAERSRSGLGVLLVGLAVVPFLFLRLHQVWNVG